MGKGRVGLAPVFPIPAQRHGEPVGVLRAELVRRGVGIALEVVEPRRAAGVVVRQRDLRDNSAAGTNTVAGAVHERTLSAASLNHADTEPARFVVDVTT